MQLQLIPQDSYSATDFLDLATSNTRYLHVCDALLDFYTFLRTTLYDKVYIRNFAKQHNLNLKRRADRITFAQLSAEVEYYFLQELPPAPVNVNVELEEVKAKLDSANEVIATQAKEIKLLQLRACKDELNGRENTPAFLALGSPRTKDQLISHFRKIRAIEHPDHSAYDKSTATSRYCFIQRLYNLVLEGWEDKFNPTLPLSQEALNSAMSVKLPFNPKSFSIN